MNPKFRIHYDEIEEMSCATYEHLTRMSIRRSPEGSTKSRTKQLNRGDTGSGTHSKQNSVDFVVKKGLLRSIDSRIENCKE